jgi:hypothetical protein
VSHHQSPVKLNSRGFTMAGASPVRNSLRR